MGEGGGEKSGEGILEVIIFCAYVFNLIKQPTLSFNYNSQSTYLYSPTQSIN